MNSRIYKESCREFLPGFLTVFDSCSVGVPPPCIVCLLLFLLSRVDSQSRTERNTLCIMLNHTFNHSLPQPDPEVEAVIWKIEIKS